MKFGIMVCLSLFAAVGGLAWYLQSATGAPREEILVRQFQGHRASYERMRDMLQADEQISRVGSFGVQTKSSPGTSALAKGEFPADRYNEYLALLKEAGATAASRSHGEHPSLCIYVWASGWAADTRHIAICWLDHEPANQVGDLEDVGQILRGSSSTRKFVFKHIEENWYIQEDW